MSKIRVLVVEDHTIVRKGIISLLEKEADVEVIGEAEDGRQAVKRVQELHPDVVVMDITLPVLNGIEATRRIKKEFPEVKVLVLSMHNAEEYVFQTLQACASGYVVKQAVPEELVSAIKAIYRGDSFLSPLISKMVIEEFIQQSEAVVKQDPHERLTDREREVLQLIGEGRKNQEIAGLLNISIKTVEAHRTHLMEKLNVHSVVELIKYAIRKGIIMPEQ